MGLLIWIRNEAGLRDRDISVEEESRSCAFAVCSPMPPQESLFGTKFTLYATPQHCIAWKLDATCTAFFATFSKQKSEQKHGEPRSFGLRGGEPVALYPFA